MNATKLIAAFKEQQKSPLQLLGTFFDCPIYIKRDDLLQIVVSDPFCGNKWRKLKFNLLQTLKDQKPSLLTFGGAYSNHIAAVASAGKHFDIPTIGIIRGGPFKELNPTLQFAYNCGMHLHYISRSHYREKDAPGFIKKLKNQFGDFYLVPEGGSNQLAIDGCKEIVDEIEVQLGGKPNFIACSCGTGGTFAGIVEAMKGMGYSIGFSSLKGYDFESVLLNHTNQQISNWDINNDYHFGGYAKYNHKLIEFINQFKSKHSIQLEPIYTGKMFYGVWDLLEKGYFPKGSNIVLYHSGGLQGIEGFNQRFGNLLF